MSFSNPSKFKSVLDLLTWRIKKIDVRKLTGEEKDELGKAMQDDSVTTSIVERAYGIHRNISGKYKSNFKNGIKNQGKAGKPTAVNDESLETLRVKIKERIGANKAPEGSDLKDFVKKAINETTVSNGRGIKLADKPSAHVLQTVIDQLGLEETTAEPLNDARRKTLADIRMFIANDVILHAWMSGIPDSLVGNMDASHEAYNKDTSRATHWAFKEGEDTSLPLKCEGGNDLDMGIKHLSLAVMSGIRAGEVIIVANAGMPDDEFDPYWIPRGGSGDGARDGCWLVFCKTRTGNEAFFKW